MDADRLRKSLLAPLLLILALWQASAHAQALDFHPPATTADPAVAEVMRDLALRVIPGYQEADTDRYLNNLSALQLVAENYIAAWNTRQSLLDRRRSTAAGPPIQQSVVYDLYAHARATEDQDRLNFAQAYTRAYQDLVPRLDDRSAFILENWLATPVYEFRDALQRAFDQYRTRPRISTATALNLIWTYLAFDAYRNFSTTAAVLDTAEDRRRYVMDQHVTISTPDGAHLSALLVRPRSAATPLPTLLEFTLDADPHNAARESASRGYAGVIAYARSQDGDRGKVLVFEHDAGDVRAVIDWITRQAWSDGRVGMYGERYSGFAAWAAARKLPPALKAIATSDATAPGVDFPMRGSIFRTSALRWIFDATNSEFPEGATDPEDAAWHDLESRWYVSGEPYRALDRMAGLPSPVFQHWLNHPSYDRYWQDVVPYGKQFAHIGIPILSITGYYASGAAGALYYFSQHYRFDPHADDTLLIGPYTDGAVDDGPAASIRGYSPDSTALLDLGDLRYQWFDQIFKNGPRPALLQDRVNYQLMGSNEWRHVPTLQAMSNAALKLYLDPAHRGEHYHLSQGKPASAGPVNLTVRLADRSDSAWIAPPAIAGRTVPARDALVFVGDALPRPVELSGMPRAHLDFVINKMDVDLYIALYEQLPDGEYIALFDPAYEFRASYVRDRVHRHLLAAGERQQLNFSFERLTSRRLQAGSRIVTVLGVVKRPDREINYGTGGDVSMESIKDAKVPMRIRWYSGSYLELPMRR